MSRYSKNEPVQLWFWNERRSSLDSMSEANSWALAEPAGPVSEYDPECGLVWELSDIRRDEMSSGMAALLVCTPGEPPRRIRQAPWNGARTPRATRTNEVYRPPQGRGSAVWDPPSLCHIRTG